MIKEINLDFLKESNKRIINNLYQLKNWGFGSDIYNPRNVNRKDGGFNIMTYSVESDYFNNDILNTYVEIISDVVNKQSLLQFKRIYRVVWNWYHQGSITEFHTDSPKDNMFSILYNLHDNDGGTEFKINDEKKFYKSIDSQALLFPSKLYHRGVSPKTNENRFSLNIVIEI